MTVEICISCGVRCPEPALERGGYRLCQWCNCIPEVELLKQETPFGEVWCLLRYACEGAEAFDSREICAQRECYLRSLASVPREPESPLFGGDDVRR